MRQSKDQVPPRAAPLTTGDFLRWGALAVLAMVGMGISAYLTYTHYADQPIACGGLGEWETVQNSEYATLIGIPVALLGILFCAGLLAVAVWRLARLPLAEEWAPLAAFSLTLMGVAFATYLTYIELFVLEALCIWCLALAAAITAAWLITIVDVLAPINE